MRISSDRIGLKLRAKRGHMRIDSAGSNAAVHKVWDRRASRKALAQLQEMMAARVHGGDASVV